MAILRAALAYWGMIFALGFVLGTMRVLWGAEALGETGFILIEVPLLLAASWFTTRWLVKRYQLSSVGAAASMGALAFALLMMAELALATALGGQTPGEWFAGLWPAPHLYGTLGQLAFGTMPVIARFSAR